MSFTNHLSAAVLNHIFSKATYTSPSLYVGLLTAAPSEDGTAILEPSTGGYSRVLLSAANWSSASLAEPSVITNSAVIVFPTATDDWAEGATLTHFGLFDGATSGNLLISGELDAPQIILDGDTSSFPVGTLIISLS